MVSLPSTLTSQRRPGIMLVNPRLKEPSPENAAKFLRWTKLHFRDMISIPEDPKLGKMTHSLRFTAPADDKKYSFDPAKGASPYFYTCHVDDLGVLQSGPYYAVSRQLDLENSRELREGEEAVGQEGMVFDVVNAEFAVYEEVPSAVPMNTSVTSYQNLALPLTPSHAKTGTPPPTHLIALSIRTSEPDIFTSNNMIPPSILGIQASLLSYLSKPNTSFKISTSLYRHAGSEAQPEMHPEIDVEARGKWLVTVLLVDEESKLGKREDVEGWVGQWADVVQEGKTGVKLSWGVWGGEVLMS